MADRDEHNIKRCPVCNDPLPVDCDDNYVEHKNCSINEHGNIVIGGE